jgi:hypothetical protein
LQIQEAAAGETIFFDYIHILKLNAAVANVIVYMGEQVLWESADAFYIHKMSPLVGRLDGFVASAQAGGLQQAWEERALLTLRRNYVDHLTTRVDDMPNSDEKRLSLNHLVIVFLMLPPAFLFPLAVLLFERVFSQRI